MLATMEWRKKLSRKEALKAETAPELYLSYKAEQYELGRRFAKSLERKEWQTIDWKDTMFIPKYLYCQKDYDDMIFDYRECRFLEKREGIPKGYLTMADGGTVPCALLSILEYYNVHVTLEELGKVFVENGYRTKDKGVLWSAMDVIPEVEYGIESKIAENVAEIAEAIEEGKPVLTLVPAAWIRQKEGLPTNQAAVIWGVKDGNFVIASTTPEEKTITRKIEEFLPQIRRAWILG